MEAIGTLYLVRGIPTNFTLSREGAFVKEMRNPSLGCGAYLRVKMLVVEDSAGRQHSVTGLGARS